MADFNNLIDTNLLAAYHDQLMTDKINKKADKDELTKKQDAIADLDTIRKNAVDGATALQLAKAKDTLSADEIKELISEHYKPEAVDALSGDEIAQLVEEKFL